MYDNTISNPNRSSSSLKLDCSTCTENILPYFKELKMCNIQDGRDVPDGTSVKFVEQLEKDLSDLSKSGCDAKIGSGGGRMGVTMDRYEADWSIVEKGWNAHVLGEAPNKFKDAKTAVVELRVRCFTILKHYISLLRIVICVSNLQ